jgi:sulfur carrier protein
MLPRSRPLSAVFFYFARRVSADEEEIMEITVNGERTSTDACSVLGLLSQLGIDPRRVAIELNLEILPKTDYGTTSLRDGDKIEIVQFVGGG